MRSGKRQLAVEQHHGEQILHIDVRHAAVVDGIGARALDANDDFFDVVRLDMLGANKCEQRIERRLYEQSGVNLDLELALGLELVAEARLRLANEIAGTAAAIRPARHRGRAKGAPPRE